MARKNKFSCIAEAPPILREANDSTNSRLISRLRRQIYFIGVNLFHFIMLQRLVFHLDEDELAVTQALVAAVIVVAQVGEFLAELLLSQDGLERVPLATGVVEPHAPCRHQRGAEPLALVEHGLIGMAYQLLKILRLPVYGDALPPDDLVGLPMGARRPLGIAALHGAYLPLLVAILLLQRLEKPFHAAAQHPVEGEGIAAQVG